MNYEMRLDIPPFERIKAGEKTIECRLNDEKRQKLRVGDTITFKRRPTEVEKITVSVTHLKTYTTFAELVYDTPLEWGGKHWKNAEDIIRSAGGLYPKTEIAKYGWLRIGVEVIQ